MKEIIMYQAEDGKIFENENECSDYEFDQFLKKLNIEDLDSKVKFYNTQKQRIPINAEFNLYDFYYMVILEDNETIRNFIEEIHQRVGYESPFLHLSFGQGTYYIDRYGDWCHYETEIEKLNEQIKGLE